MVRLMQQTREGLLEVIKEEAAVFYELLIVQVVEPLVDKHLGGLLEGLLLVRVD